MEAAANLKKVLASSWAQLKQRHVADYQALFNRVKLNLGTNEETVKLPTDERLRSFRVLKTTISYKPYITSLAVTCSLPAHAQVPGRPTCRVSGTIMYNHPGAVTIPPISIRK
ncbi:glycosyl hydrolase family 95 catalytic domain-containing protein [Paraflavitalea speifideaquila]|uniref:glycosyl hydrolase family 95 catalytic domain-containing protein n=1 Tax=Paraflavitalea speifideaquila TaxID=3076558 RepID=UPI003CCE40FF